MKQHYCPECYLKGFVEPETPEGQEPALWVLDLKSGAAKRRAPKNVAYEINYYSFPDKKGEVRNDVEELLSKVESDVKPILTKLLSGEYDLTELNRGNLSYFMALFVTRVPFFRNMVADMVQQISKLMLQMRAGDPKRFAHGLREATKREYTEKESEEFRQFVLDDSRYTLEANPALSLSMIMPIANEIAPILYTMKWAFLVPSEGGAFLTGDNPVSWVDPTPRPAFLQGHGLMMRNVELTFPIGPHLCLFGTWQGVTGRQNAPAAVVTAMNKRTRGWAERYLFRHAEDALPI